jgi:hypothetical protein
MVLTSTLILFTNPVVAMLNNEIQAQHSTDIKVPVQLGVMSRCPDALLCESVFDRVVPNVTRKIDLSLAYVAK